MQNRLHGEGGEPAIATMDKYQSSCRSPTASCCQFHNISYATCYLAVRIVDNLPVGCKQKSVLVCHEMNHRSAWSRGSEIWCHLAELRLPRQTPP